MGLRSWNEVAETLRDKGCTQESVRPVRTLTDDESFRLEERSAIMEHDGGLSREQADKYAWCREVCILIPGQRELCERVKPCLKGGKWIASREKPPLPKFKQLGKSWPFDK